MAFSQDSDLVDLVPDILSLGITSFADDHAKSQADIERELRLKWGDIDNNSATSISGFP